MNKKLQIVFAPGSSCSMLESCAQLHANKEEWWLGNRPRRRRDKSVKFIFESFIWQSQHHRSGKICQYKSARKWGKGISLTAPRTRCVQSLAIVLINLDVGEKKTHLDVTVDGELTSGQSTNHEQTSTNTTVATTETEFLGDLDQSASGALTGETLGLVDLGQHSIGGLRDNGGSETGNQTRTQVDDSLGSIRGSVLVDRSVDGLGDLLVDDELGHGVRDLLEQDGTETAVESTETFRLRDLAETRDETGGEGRLGHETDTGGFEGAEGNVGEEFSGSGGGEVDGGSVVGGGFVTELVDTLLLEELVSTKLESTLQEVTSEGRADTGQQSACALVGNDFSETSDHAIVVRDGVELDSGLDAEEEKIVRSRMVVEEGFRAGNLHIDGSEATVGDGATDSTSEGLERDISDGIDDEVKLAYESAVEAETRELLRLVGLCDLNCGIELGRAGRGWRKSGSHCE